MSSKPIVSTLQNPETWSRITAAYERSSCCSSRCRMSTATFELKDRIRRYGMTYRAEATQNTREVSRHSEFLRRPDARGGLLLSTSRCLCSSVGAELSYSSGFRRSNYVPPIMTSFSGPNILISFSTRRSCCILCSNRIPY